MYEFKDSIRYNKIFRFAKINMHYYEFIINYIQNALSVTLSSRPRR